MTMTHDTRTTTPSVADPTYWFEQNDAESQRLMLQSRLFNPIAKWILLRAGVTAGMTVLDVGSGPGDVALLAAELVGPRGAVVGVDSNPEVLELARARAALAGYANVTFVADDCRTADLGSGFDAVVGRFILMYVSDPAATLHSLSRRLRPGGIIAFQETNVAEPTIQTTPPMPTWRQVTRWIAAAGEQAGLDMQTGYHLRQTFIDAGLPAPQMQLDAIVGGGPDWDGHEYITATLRNMLPLVYAAGAATPGEVDIDTLADRLRAEAVAHNSTIKGPDIVSAWTRLS